MYVLWQTPRPWNKQMLLRHDRWACLCSPCHVWRPQRHVEDNHLASSPVVPIVFRGSNTTPYPYGPLQHASALRSTPCAQRVWAGCHSLTGHGTSDGTRWSKLKRSCERRRTSRAPVRRNCEKTAVEYYVHRLSLFTAIAMLLLEMSTNPLS